MWIDIAWRNQLVIITYIFNATSLQKNAGALRKHDQAYWYSAKGTNYKLQTVKPDSSLSTKKPKAFWSVCLNGEEKELQNIWESAL